MPLTPDQVNEALDEARSCLRTPYRAHAKLKGGGFDCATLLLHVYQKVGCIPNDFELGHYSIQIHLHQSDTQYIETVLQFADEITEAEAQAGDIVMYKVGHGFHHGAIIESWPSRIIHAVKGQGVIYSHGTDEYFTKRREKRF